MNTKFKKILTIVPGIIALFTGVMILALFAIKWIWAWTIPDLFPGAVEQGLIAKEISWFTSLKLSIFVAILSGTVKVNSKK